MKEDDFSTSFPKVLILKPEDIVEPFLECKSNPSLHYTGLWNELGKAMTVLPKTWLNEIPFLIRVHDGKNPDEPNLSLKDYEILKRRGKFAQPVIANALSSLNSILQKASRVRKAPDLQTKFSIVVYECMGLPPRIYHLLIAWWLHKFTQTKASEGHEEKLETELIIDEGLPLYSTVFNAKSSQNFPKFTPKKKCSLCM